MNYGKCKDCIHRRGIRCEKRTMVIDPKFVRVWGCDHYKANYESLIKENK